MAMENKDQRTEQPTGRRIDRALEEGNVARSQEIGQAMTLGLFLLWCAIGGGAFLNQAMVLVRESMRTAGKAGEQAALVDQLWALTTKGMWMTLPLLVLIALGGIAANLVQGGFHSRKQLIRFNWQGLNPVTGMRNFVNLKKLVNALKALLRAGFYALLAAWVVIPEWDKVAALALGTPGSIFGETVAMTGRVLNRALLLAIAIAAADFAFTKYQWWRNLFMTKQEVRDEVKESENPEMRGRMRGRMREVTRRRMMAAVRTADVVVTNPTHVAVALKYDRQKMAAPTVVAKGRDYMALRIKEEARKHQVPLLEDPPLARTLERLVPLGAPIPETLYRAVAEVFAFVLGRRRGVYQPHPELEAALEVNR